MTPTQARDRATSLIQRNPDGALKLARSIADPWFKCQALASVGRYWPAPRHRPILADAVKAADAVTEPYHRASIAAWPIRAYLERDEPESAKPLLADALQTALQIENLGGRCEAIFLLFQAARSGEAEFWLPAFQALARSAEPAMSWRQGRALGEAVSMIETKERHLIEDTLGELSDERNLAAVRKGLAAQGAIRLKPRPFFWLRDA